MSSAYRPADNLLGLTLENGWTVKSKLAPSADATGGYFSVGYIVSHETKPDGFLKALDYSRALSAQDPARSLLVLTSAYVFECDICLMCAKRSFDHVVVAVDHGRCTVSGPRGDDVVQYIIFELAAGDVRRHLDELDASDYAFPLRALHNVAVGLRQLHSAQCAHQDLKPSNVLRFNDNRSKIADLGRASAKELATASPFDNLIIAGDKGYAPPELLYGHAITDWHRRRLGCDLYLFGSLVLFMFTRTNMTGQLLSRIPEDYHPRLWSGDYYTVLPFLHNAFSHTLNEASPSLPEEHRGELTEMIRQLCEPDPQRRGHPETISQGPNAQSLERYISQLDLLATKAESQRPGKRR